MKKPSDNDLTLDQVEATLRDILRRLHSIKAESNAIQQMKPTRNEIADSLNQWLDKHIESGNAALYSRLNAADFLTGNNSNSSPGILFAKSAVGWEENSCHPAGLLPLLSPVIRSALMDWLAGLPSESLGSMTTGERSAKLAGLESERQSLLERRRNLQQRLRQADHGGDPPAELLSRQFAGGVLLHSNPRELADKVVARI